MNAAPMLALVLAIPLAGPRALMGQARPPVSPGVEDSATQSEMSLGATAGEPTLDREVFVYPEGDRRDPFERLLPGNSAGTRFEELRLIGVIHSPKALESVALVSSATSAPAASAGMGERTFRLRRDVVLGDMRVLQVEQERVIVEIRRFGAGERRELRLDRQRGSAR